MTEKEIVFSLSKDKGDFTVQFFRSPGPGGQKVNKTSSAARITHKASGAVGESHTYRHQIENKKAAFRRCIESEKFQTWLKLELARRGIETEQPTCSGPTGNRGEKIRTYNYVRDTVKDHRTGVTINDIQNVLDGDLDKLIDSCQMLEERMELKHGG